MKRTLLTLVAIAALVSGCIVTGNIVITIDIGDLTANATESFSYQDVDLNDYPDYVDHKDDLNTVDDMGFVCRIKNTSDKTATGQLWISKTSSTQSLPSDKVLVLDGLVIQPGKEKREITLSESYDYLTNFEEVRDIVLGEVFTAYFTSKTTPFTLEVTDLAIILSINGKP